MNFVNLRFGWKLWWSVLFSVMLIVGWAITPAQAHCKGKHKETHEHCIGGGDPPPPVNADPAIVYLRDGGIYVADANGTNELLVIQATKGTSYGDPSWSPEGDKLVVGVRSSDPEVETGVYTIAMVINEESWTGNWGPLNKVARRTGRGYGNPAWHPIYPVIAYEDLADAADDIFLVNDDGTSVGSPVNLTNTPGTYERKLSWSSDGNQFAAEEWYPDISDVVVYNFNSDDDPPITRVTSLVRVDEFNPLGGPVTQGCPENFECIRINEVSWSKGQPDLVAVATNNRVTPEWVDDVWCVQVDDPMDAVNLTNSIPGEEGARDPTWSPDNSQMVALTQLFVQKGNAKVGRYDSSLIKLNLSSNGSGLCPAVLDPVLDVQTILDPDVGEFIGHADWQR